MELINLIFKNRLSNFTLQELNALHFALLHQRTQSGDTGFSPEQSKLLHEIIHEINARTSKAYSGNGGIEERTYNFYE